MSETPTEAASAPAEPDQVPVHVALSRVMRDVQAVAKKDRNDFQKFNFRGIDAVVNAVGPAFRTHGVLCLPNVVSQERWTDTTKKDGTQLHVLLEVHFTFVGPSGDVLNATTYGEAFDSGDKAFSKAHSVAYRTCLLQALCIPTDEPDPDSFTSAPVVNPAVVEFAQRIDAAGEPVVLLNVATSLTQSQRRAVVPWGPDGQEVALHDIILAKAADLLTVTEDVDALRTLHKVAAGLRAGDLAQAIRAKAGAAEKTAEQQARDAADANGTGEPDEDTAEPPAGAGMPPEPDAAQEPTINYADPRRKAVTRDLATAVGGMDALEKMVAQEFSGRHINKVPTDALVGLLETIAPGEPTAPAGAS